MNWSKVKHFKREEFGKDADKMKDSIVFELDRLRGYLGTPIVVSSAFRRGNGSSQHHFGLAVDILFPELSLPALPDILIDILRFDFHGVGIYPHWSLKKDAPPIGGFHLDHRTEDLRAFWMGVPSGKGGTDYIVLSHANLTRFFGKKE